MVFWEVEQINGISKSKAKIQIKLAHLAQIGVRVHCMTYKFINKYQNLLADTKKCQ